MRTTLKSRDNKVLWKAWITKSCILPDHAARSSKASRILYYDISYCRLSIILGHLNKAVKLAAGQLHHGRKTTYLDNISRLYRIKIPSRGRTHFVYI